MSVAELSAAIQVRFTAKILRDLTNEDASATTINTTRLEAACEDAMGEFHRITGIDPDTSNRAHISILQKGVLYFLEF